LSLAHQEGKNEKDTDNRGLDNCNLCRPIFYGGVWAGEIMKLTKAIKQKHYDLWDWLYHHPSKEKKHYPKWKINGGKIIKPQYECFLCTVYNNMFSCNCDRCPLGKKGGVCNIDKNNWFNIWDYAGTPKTRKKYAKLIRDIFVEEVK
jgi:hypothetical protein